MCTLYKEVPHGIAIINYEDPKNDWESFRGVGIFYHGKLHNTPFSFLKRNDCPYSFSKMHNGRPADSSYYTEFIEDGETEIVHPIY